MKKVCFVCLGNICRSPMAEFVMKNLDEDGRLQVVSRATSGWEHGNPIHTGTRRIFQKHKIAYSSQKRSQQIAKQDLETFDFIIGMDKQNVADLKRLSNGLYDRKIFLFAEGGVPDPWYTGDFDATYIQVKAGCQRWLERILKD
ncbi:low molecular weight protein-tyrosine-phosphatase [Streptococcus caballi]|uniref:low molecular weight protein-tyrosine-phosphatase n=1 Tax=Streptococcus caballi TaxID=439220 RepID=UPI00037F60EE|nr:low molecular weight protein-tyrosine-phosphatase [Streptococcus caballi]